MLDPLFSLVEQAALRIERPRTFLVLFAGVAALLLLQLWPAAWTGNEEQYLQLAYRTFAPEEFSPFHAVSVDHSQARFVPLYLLGSAVELLGYDGAQAVARILMAILYATGIAYFFSALRLSVWDASLVIVVFLLSGEHLIGGEWLFQGVETKTLAYGLLFFALGFAVRQRWTAATLVGAAATYMHFLVGGFWTLLILIQQWLDTRQVRGVLRGLAAYGMLTLPLAWLIARDRLGGAAVASELVDTIYAERVPWHVAPFASRGEFWDWTVGIARTVALLLVLGAIRLRHRTAGSPVAMVWRTALFGLAYLLLALVPAFLDRHTQLLAKFYLFRPGALTLFLALTAIVALLSERLTNGGAALKALLAFGLVASFSWRTVKTQVDRFRTAGATIPERGELVAAIASRTAPGDVVLIEPFHEFQPDYISLHREIRRPTLVSRKFLPANPADILRWHSYLELRKHLFANGCTAPTPVPVRWLVTLQAKSAAGLAGCGPSVWRSGNVALIPVPYH